MTEDEAKTKWCPHARALFVGNAGPHPPSNRFGTTHGPGTPERWNSNPEGSRCIASACMAWRWEKVPNPDWKPQGNQMAMWPPTNPYAGDPAHVFSTTNGRCGLAGQQ